MSWVDYVKTLLVNYDQEQNPKKMFNILDTGLIIARANCALCATNKANEVNQNNVYQAFKPFGPTKTELKFLGKSFYTVNVTKGKLAPEYIMNLRCQGGGMVVAYTRKLIIVGIFDEKKVMKIETKDETLERNQNFGDAANAVEGLQLLMWNNSS